MDEREEHIRRLKEAIKDAKRLRSEMQAYITDMNRLLRVIKNRPERKLKLRKPN